jgi:hypothetical protein
MSASKSSPGASTHSFAWFQGLVESHTDSALKRTRAEWAGAERT